MSKAKKGDKVKVHYTGSLANGEVFDSSLQRQEPIGFEVGAGQMIKGFDDAVDGMAINEEKNVVIPADEAYGEWQEAQIFEFSKNDVPADMKPKKGDSLMVQDNEGRNIPVVVHNVTDEAIFLDANHPLAGKELIFDIQLLEIEG
jgi:peptidylprolyl isomerase